MKPERSMFNERAANGFLVLAALVIASVVVVREFRGGGRTAQAAGLTAPEFHEDWATFLDAGLEIGTAGSPTTLMIFNDFECGGCKLFHDRLIERLREAGDLSIRLLHKPLRGHQFAVVAARAAECADRQGKGRELVHGLFARQDSLGVKSWEAFGAEAAVADVPSFVECVTGDEELPRIAAGLQIAERLGVTGTPTLMLNGWLLRGIPSEEQFLAAIAAVKAGGKPTFE